MAAALFSKRLGSDHREARQRDWPWEETKNMTKTSEGASLLGPSTVPWKRVAVFVSSTFSDMHAERDYLVKRVFPDLHDWCERRRLRLVDVDLRWGWPRQSARSGTAKSCL